MGFVPVCWTWEEKSLVLILQLYEVSHLVFTWFFASCGTRSSAFLLLFVLLIAIIFYLSLAHIIFIPSFQLYLCLFVISDVLRFRLQFCYSLFFLNICLYTLHYHFICAKYIFLFFARACAKCVFVTPTRAACMISQYLTATIQVEVCKQLKTFCNRTLRWQFYLSKHLSKLYFWFNT